MTNPWTILDGFGGENVVAVRPALIRLFGASAAILLAQLLYWQRRTGNGNDWTYNDQGKLEGETGLSPDSQRTARAALVAAGVLQEARAGIPARLHYLVVLDALVAALEQGPKPARAARGEQGRFTPANDDQADNDQLSGTPTTSNREPRQQDHGNPEHKTTGTPTTRSSGIPISLRKQDPGRDPSKIQQPPAAVDQNLSNPQPPTPPARALSPVAPGRLASFGPRTPNPKPVPSQAQAGNRPTGCESLPAAREENYKLLAAYFDRPNMSRYPDVLEEWQASAASWTQFPTPYLEIVLNTARGLRPGVTESGPGFAVLALSNPSSLKLPDDIRAVLAQSRPSSASPALRNPAAPKHPGVWLKGDGQPITVLEWYENGACLTDRGDFPTALTRAWKPVLPLEMEAV